VLAEVAFFCSLATEQMSAVHEYILNASPEDMAVLLAQRGIRCSAWYTGARHVVIHMIMCVWNCQWEVMQDGCVWQYSLPGSRHLYLAHPAVCLSSTYV
jgi:hypothetical protein